MIPEVNFVQLNGNALERGILHGQQLQDKLHAFSEDGLCRLNYLQKSSLSLASLREKIAIYRSVIHKWLPDLAQEVEGLAIGAELPPDMAWLFQLRREVLGYSRISTSGDCTTLASINNGVIVAQTVDLNGNLDDCISVLNCQGPRFSSILLSFSGLLGYLGFNNSGLAIGLNLVLGGEWTPGVPPYLVVRHLLDNCANVAEGLDLLQTIPLSSSRSFTLCDKQRAVCVEVLNNQFRIVSDGKMTAHTNHFLHPDFQSQDEINIFAKNSSIHRLNAAQALIEQDTMNASDCFNMFTRSPVCVKSNGDIRRERTVAAVVMLPEKGKMLLRPGDPSLSSTHCYSL